MSSSIPYSAEQDDLFYPCKRGEFFPAGRPESEAALCAEMARLAYCKQESSFAFDQDKIRSILRGIGFNDCKCFESQTDPKGKGVHCFLASRDDKQLAIVAFHFGKPYYIDVSRKVIFDPSHFFMLEDGLHGDLEYVEKYLRPGHVLLRGLADHAPINCVWPLAALGSLLTSSLQAATSGG